MTNFDLEREVFGKTIAELSSEEITDAQGFVLGKLQKSLPPKTRRDYLILLDRLYVSDGTFARTYDSLNY